MAAGAQLVHAPIAEERSQALGIFTLSTWRAYAKYMESTRNGVFIRLRNGAYRPA